MTHIRIQLQKIIRGKGLLTAALLLAMTGFASVAGATYSLPAYRAVTWEGNVGVKNDIPSRSTVYKTLNPSGGDDTSAIQGAITACPADQIVQLGKGTFNVSSPITVKSNMTLRGAGMGSTIIKGKAGMGGAYLVGIKGGPTLGAAVGLVGGMSKGSSTITTSAPHGWAAGDIILVDQLNAPQDDPPVKNIGSNNAACTWCGRSSGTRSLGQMVKVAATPTSTTATLEMPLYWNYEASLSPQAVKLSSMVTNAGIERLTVDNRASGSSSQASDGGTILLRGTANSWLVDVEAIGAWETMVRMYGTYRTTVRGGKFHTGVSPTGSSQYCMWLGPYASANLIENNQMYNLTSGVMLNGATSGNVIGYNYITAISMSDRLSWNMSAIGTHGAHPMMNLIEGNYIEGARLRNDNVWGSSSHNTLFRNRSAVDSNRSSGAWDVDLHSAQQYYSMVGNVFGWVGVETVYELQNMNLSGQKSIYRFGYMSDGDGSSSGNDSLVYSTSLRHGNWDSVTNGTVWEGAEDQTLPASLYLSGKPSWWGSMQWPCIGPDVKPLYPASPGAGKGTPWGTAKPRLSPPVLVSVQ